MTKQVDIAGGGVAGLALGLALRRAGVPVRIHEAGTYPRHRLCGEFLSGVGEREFDALGLSALFAETEELRDMAWFDRNRPAYRDALPEPALALSRWRMEAAMVQALTAQGGEVKCEDRVAVPPENPEGWVVATGRPAGKEGRWYAEKEHYLNLETVAGLEMHLGNEGYAGLARIGQGVVNVCAMLPAAAGKMPQSTLADRLRACGLTDLAERLGTARLVAGSHCGTSRFFTGWQKGMETGVLRLGDSAAVIPPFTGNGMSMAIEGAIEAAPSLTDWSAGRAPWGGTVERIHAGLHRRFRTRLKWAARLHPLLLRPAGRFFLSFIFRSGFNPSRWLYRRLR